jgi:beta-galactosidase
VDVSLNGRSLGSKRSADATAGVLSWTVPFAPGVLTATAATAGKAVADFSLRTAGPARRIELVRDGSAVISGGGDTAQLEFRIVDDAGVRVPDSRATVTFEIAGPARLLGIGNGDLNNVENPREPVHQAYQGRGLVILRITDRSAPVTIKASSPGLDGATLTLSPAVQAQAFRR